MQAEPPWSTFSCSISVFVDLLCSIRSLAECRLVQRGIGPFTAARFIRSSEADHFHPCRLRENRLLWWRTISVYVSVVLRSLRRWLRPALRPASSREWTTPAEKIPSCRWGQSAARRRRYLARSVPCFRPRRPAARDDSATHRISCERLNTAPSHTHVTAVGLHQEYKQYFSPKEWQAVKNGLGTAVCAEKNKLRSS